MFSISYGFTEKDGFLCIIKIYRCEFHEITGDFIYLNVSSCYDKKNTVNDMEIYNR